MELIAIPELSLEFPATIDGSGFSLLIPGLKLRAGELTFIMGHNGSGKSLYIRSISGEIPTDQELGSRSVKRAGIVRQQAELSLAGDLTVAENFLVRMRPEKWIQGVWPRKTFQRQIEAILAKHPEIRRKMQEPCRNLSVGQRQTLAFLVVSSERLSLLLLDEFLASTDYRTSSILLELARDYAETTPAGVVIVSHDIDLALSEADRVIVLKQGRLVKDLARDSPEWTHKDLSEAISYSSFSA